MNDFIAVIALYMAEHLVGNGFVRGCWDPTVCLRSCQRTGCLVVAGDQPGSRGEPILSPEVTGCHRLSPLSPAVTGCHRLSPLSPAVTGCHRLSPVASLQTAAARQNKMMPECPVAICKEPGRHCHVVHKSRFTGCNGYKVIHPLRTACVLLNG